MNLRVPSVVSGASRSIRAVLLAVLATTLLAVVACTPGTTPTAALRRLNVGATIEPPTMDPSSNTAAAVPQVMLYNVYETLIRVDAEGQIRPLLAQRWDVSADGLTYTFQLNPAAKFASGTPVDAKAVIASIERIKSSGFAVLQKQMEVVKSTAAVDDKTLTVTLSHPSNMWLYNMTSTAGMVYDPAGFADLATKTAGSGPFRLKQWNKGQGVVLERNQSYWGTPPRLDEVTFRYFSDPNAMNAALLSGDIDVISNVQAPEAIDQFKDTSKYTVIEGTTNGEVVLGLNHQTAALKNLKVRQAITMAIDRKALLTTVWNGRGTLIGSMVPPTDPWYEDLSGTNPYNPTKAKQLLAEAGFAGGLNLRMRIPALPYASKGGAFVASQLKEIGISVTIEELEFTRWLDEVYTKANYDLTIVAHVEPRDIVKFADPKYYWRYANTDFQKLMTTADEVSAEAQIPLMKQGAKLLADDAAAVWLFLLPNLVVTKASVTGVPANATTLSFDLTSIANG